MKSLIILLLFSTSVFVQAPKKASKIIIANQFSQSQNFKNAVNTLIDNDYIISRSDSTSGTILTDESADVRLYIVARSNKITVSGHLKAEPISLRDKTDWLKIENRGMKGSPFAKAFLKMDKFASKLSGTKTYE